MRAAALVTLLLAACAAEDQPVRPAAEGTGDLVYRFGTYSVRLTDMPCPFEDFIEELEAEGIPPARAAVITSGQRRHTGCWVRDMSGDVMMRQADAELGVLPAEGFRREPEA